MSMLADLRRVRPETLERLRADPSDIFWFLHGSEPYRPPRGLLARLFGPREPPRPEREPWQPPPAEELLSLDKTWHCLHFLLAGEPWEGELPAASLLAGGSELGEVDVGYGPARALAPEQVADFHRHLESVSESELRERCDPEQMEAAEIYGAVRSRDELSALWPYLEALRDFLGRATADGDAVIVYLY